jgi:hypothetical protein
MNKWRWILGIVSAIQLLWGLLQYIEYDNSVGAVSEPTGAWMYCVLGLSGLLVLALPRFGIPVAMVQGLAAGYALCWMPLAIVCLQAPLVFMLPVPFGYPVLAMLILLTAGATAVLCLLGAVGSVQVSRLTKRCTA